MASKLELPGLSEILAPVDLDAVATAIAATEGSRPLADYDFEDAKRCVYTAAETWLPRDVVEFSNLRFEDHFHLDAFDTKGYLDLWGNVTGLVKQLVPYAGATFIADWKTTAGELDDRWRSRNIDSWQWRIYAYAKQAKLFFYRGISRRGTTKEIILEVPVTNNEEVEEFLRGAKVLRDSLLSFHVLPRNMPGACNTYNRECPYYVECCDYSMPKQPPEDKTLSYTRIKTLLLCPERYRRDQFPGASDETEESNFGLAVHRGMANLYQQVFSEKP